MPGTPHCVEHISSSPLGQSCFPINSKIGKKELSLLDKIMTFICLNRSNTSYHHTFVPVLYKSFRQMGKEIHLGHTQPLGNASVYYFCRQMQNKINILHVSFIS